MKLFGQLVRTVVNTALVPVAIAVDVKDVAIGEQPVATKEAIQRLKDEAGEDA